MRKDSDRHCDRTQLIARTSWMFDFAQTYKGPCRQIQNPCKRKKRPCELERSIGNLTSCTRVLQCLTRWSQLPLRHLVSVTSLLWLDQSQIKLGEGSRSRRLLPIGHPPCSLPLTILSLRNSFASMVDVFNIPRELLPGRLVRSDFWFHDGNIVIIAGSAAFKVHRDQLKRHSEIFSDLFSILQPM